MNEYEHVAHHVVPSFCCLQVSDTGNFIKWKNVSNRQDGLKRGDHVAWLRPFGYWHHAIVQEVTSASAVEVIEWSSSVNCQCKATVINSTKTKSCWDICCRDPMYKVHYPTELEEQNPPDLVLMRALARVNEDGYRLWSNNCEHFATFCKTGVHRSDQIFQMNVSMHAWIRNILWTLIHLSIISVISEGVEEITEELDKNCANDLDPPFDKVNAKCKKQLIAYGFLVYSNLSIS